MIFIGELQQGAIGADGDDPQGDRLAASSQSSVGGPPQQGTSMRSRVTLWMELAARMAVSFSA